ncbi:HAD family hydrolase [Pelagibaculum spongiae]|uniref:HAD family hydrolase n=1 Tax=Pelagibaculum spongiae TaxID=2080658 RepID=A0A2V1GRX3_9GAMM|nr:HAD-IA family hydrolase [Pelagibaculum spongiae]PVZ65617.1 HAD family hydrolase [Pelagibaculum spongiae]
MSQSNTPNYIENNKLLSAEFVKAISFDLDDTLWDNIPVIMGAERALWGWLNINAPRIAKKFSMWEMIQQRQLLSEKYPELAHDLSALRIKGLTLACEVTGEDPVIAKLGYDFFIQERNRIFIAPEVFSLLEELKKHYQLCAITNGNSDINRLGLDKYFDFSISPKDAGVLKPAKKIFHMAAEQLKLQPAQIAHVGDSLETDVMGANQAGFVSIWFNGKSVNYGQAAQEQQLGPQHRPAVEINCLQQLRDLLP